MRGLVVRSRGSNLILAREEQFQADQPPVLDDRVRLSWLGGNQFGLSARTWNGKWESTPFTGTMEEMLDTIESLMPHLIGSWVSPAGNAAP